MTSVLANKINMMNGMMLTKTGREDVRDNA